MTEKLSLVRRAGPQDVPRPQVPQPVTLEDAGLSLDLLTQLILKTLYFAGELTGGELSKRLGVAFPVIEPSLEFIKGQRHGEVVAGGMIGGSSYRYRITSEGRAVAGLFLEQNHYLGVAPVPLAQYRQYMARLPGEVQPTVTQSRVRDALGQLVLSDTVLDEIGPAINGGRSIFIYGPPGNGKTAIAHAIRDLLVGDVLIPHAIEVEGSIIRVFDPVNHEVLSSTATESEDTTLARDPAEDGRWLACRRPMVKAGGELSLESLDLSYDPRLGYYRAPLQLVANGGVLIIDDFGRQRCAPHDLLNRWMVPLESGLDYLTLRSGLKFEVPFHVFVAFATNIEPSQLVDEAFLRRVQYKVFAEDPSRANFVRIFEACCRERDLGFDPALVEHLLDGFYRAHAVTPRACHPRDLINQALLLAGYRGQPRRLTTELLETACSSYFVVDRD